MSGTEGADDAGSDSHLKGKKDDVIPERNADYQTVAYWDERFGREVEYDWLLTFPQVGGLLTPYLLPSDRILMVGCGNSTFSCDLYSAGFKNITNIDFSGVVIKRMQEQHQDKEGMSWAVMDMTALEYPDSSFDVVIDKAAMDALVTDEGSVWEPKPEVVASVHRMCRSVLRVLRPGGLFIQYSFAQPHFRAKYLKGEHAREHELEGSSVCDYAWDYSATTIGAENTKTKGCFDYYMFTCRKASA